jgi:hypothetical protein
MQEWKKQTRRKSGEYSSQKNFKMPFYFFPDL